MIPVIPFLSALLITLSSTSLRADDGDTDVLPLPPLEATESQPIQIEPQGGNPDKGEPAASAPGVAASGNSLSADPTGYTKAPDSREHIHRVAASPASRYRRSP